LAARSAASAASRRRSRSSASYVQHERAGLGKAPSLREFVAGFDGLRGSTKPPEVLEEAGLKGSGLADLLAADAGGEAPFGRLLECMRRKSRPVQPDRLGAVRENNLLRAATAFWGADGQHRYAAFRGEAGGRPFVVEAVMVPLEYEKSRELRFGVNWTPALTIPFDFLHDVLDDVMVGEEDPLFLAVHVVTPYAGYTDQGKTRASLPDEVAEAVEKALVRVTKPHTQDRRKQIREEEKVEREAHRRRREKVTRGPTFREAAFQVLPEVHAMVTGGDVKAPARARQMMYQARPRVQRLTGGKCWRRDSTFTQRILIDFMERNPELTKDWNVVFDARGRLVEPHTRTSVELGTLQVRDYVARWSRPRPAGEPGARATAEQHAGGVEASAERAPEKEEEVKPSSLLSYVNCRRPGFGPAYCYEFVLLVEKEGFRELIEYARIAERYDVAAEYTKGMSTTAQRELVEALTEVGVTTLVLHDFDFAGMTIYHTLANTTKRFRYKKKPLVKDIGLRLADVQKMELDGEDVIYRRRKKDPRLHLARIGATEEQEYLVGRREGNAYHGRRVELNAMTNPQFIEFIGAKLAEAGVKKVVPDQRLLEEMFVNAVRTAHLARHAHDAVRAARAAADSEAWRLYGGMVVEPPADLKEQVAKLLEKSEASWDVALSDLVLRHLSRQG
jgi:hypothetical protein